MENNDDGATDKTGQSKQDNPNPSTPVDKGSKCKGIVWVSIPLVAIQIGLAFWIAYSKSFWVILLYCILFFATIIMLICSSKKSAATSQTGEGSKNLPSAAVMENDGIFRDGILAEYAPLIISIAGSMCVTFLLVFFICEQKTFFGMASCLVLALGAGATIEKGIDAITKALGSDASTPERIKGGVMTGFYGVLLVALLALLCQAPETVTQLLVSNLHG